MNKILFVSAKQKILRRWIPLKTCRSLSMHTLSSSTLAWILILRLFANWYCGWSQTAGRQRLKTCGADVGGIPPISCSSECLFTCAPTQLSRLVESRRLMDVGELEQEMVCGLDHSSAIDRVTRFVHDHNGCNFLNL